MRAMSGRGNRAVQMLWLQSPRTWGSSHLLARAIHNSSKMSVKQVLVGRPPSTFTVDQTATIKQAINHLVTMKVSSSLILDSSQEIVGIVTARDLLSFMNDISSPHTSSRSLHGPSGTDASLSHKVTDAMTPVERMIYCSPKDTVRHCREIMFQLKIRHMPVIEGSSVVGIVTMKDLSDAEFNNVIHGGKKGYISNVIGRKGLPRGTRVQCNTNISGSDGRESGGERGDSSSCGGTAQLRPVFPLSTVRSGSYTLPHPFKTSTGVAGNRRQYGADDLCEDNSLNEDAHFVMSIELPNLATPVPLVSSTLQQVYACVADGVGNWRQYGVDPKEYSHRLVQNTRSVIEAESSRRLEDFVLYEASHRGSNDKQKLKGGGVDVSADACFRGDDLVQSDEAVHPLDAILEAWYMTNRDQHIIGSSTICVATIDVSTNQLSYSNIGDGGLMVVRHIPRDGTLNAKVEKDGDGDDGDNANYKIAYLAQQQLRSFNFPFQLGNGGADYEGVFERPMDADTASIPLMPQDVVVMASDGLFDNLSISEIIAIISTWEKERGEGSGSDSDSASASTDQPAQALAKSLVLAAREASLDKEKDSPFALLAKENDIMWGGGMPDDTTVVILQLEGGQ